MPVGREEQQDPDRSVNFLFVLIWTYPDEPDEGRFSSPFSISWLGHRFSPVGSHTGH